MAKAKGKAQNGKAKHADAKAVEADRKQGAKKAKVAESKSKTATQNGNSVDAFGETVQAFLYCHYEDFQEMYPYDESPHLCGVTAKAILEGAEPCTDLFDLKIPKGAAPVGFPDEEGGDEDGDEGGEADEEDAEDEDEEGEGEDDKEDGSTKKKAAPKGPAHRNGKSILQHLFDRNNRAGLGNFDLTPSSPVKKGKSFAIRATFAKEAPEGDKAFVRCKFLEAECNDMDGWAPGDEKHSLQKEGFVYLVKAEAVTEAALKKKILKHTVVSEE